MDNFNKIIYEAVSNLITKADVISALEDALKNYDFSEHLQNWAEVKLEEIDADYAIQEAVSDIADDLIS